MKPGARDRQRLGELLERMLNGHVLVWVRTPDGESWQGWDALGIRRDGLVVVGRPWSRRQRLVQVGQLRTEDPR